MIAYYVHHHGTGHLHRAAAVAAALDVPVVGLSSTDAPAGWPGRWVRLSPDEGAGADATAGGTLHWAPRHHDGLRDRMATISAVLSDPAVRLLVADVSVEVSLLARLHGVPVVVMAQPGDRLDRPHRTAYDLAERLLAPWPSSVVPDWPQAWHRKTVNLGGLSRFDGRPSPEVPRSPTEVLVLWGSGGVDVPPSAVQAAARSTPAWRWRVAGPTGSDRGAPGNLETLGWVDDPWPLLHSAAVVVSHAGQNAVAELAAARAPAVVIPQGRPHGEQHATAAVLASAGLASVSTDWPDAGRWPGILADAGRRGGDGWAGWSTGDGARRAARVLDGLAAP